MSLFPHIDRESDTTSLFNSNETNNLNSDDIGSFFLTNTGIEYNHDDHDDHESFVNNSHNKGNLDNNYKPLPFNEDSNNFFVDANIKQSKKQDYEKENYIENQETNPNSLSFSNIFNESNNLYSNIYF